MVVVLLGGLGNQLFQYACARCMSLLFGMTTLVMDVSWYKNEPSSREYMLSHFNIPQNCTTYKADISDRSLNMFLKFTNGYVTADNAGYDATVEGKIANLLPRKRKIILKGYFQSEKYFIKNEQIIRKDLEIITPPSENAKGYINQIQNCESSVALHVRRGDFMIVKNPLTKERNIVLDTSYYKKAAAYIVTKVKTPVFFIFSDDISWCSEHIPDILPKNAKYVFVKGNSPIDDLRLMSMCRHNIIANSSFSWWGAWLNNNKNKIVIASKKWPNGDGDPLHDIVPSNWIKF